MFDPSPRISGRRRAARLVIAAFTALVSLSFTSAPAPADPPPWAPAHGYRAKKGKPKFEQRGRQLPPGLRKGRCSARMFDDSAVGTLIGAAAGGYVGSHAGKGDGRLAATALGTLIGAVVGHQISGSIARPDEICFNQTFEHAPDRETVTWNNTRQGAEYQVTPTKTVRTRAGAYCREYQAKASVGGKTSDTYGTACRQPDGSWKLIN